MAKVPILGAPSDMLDFGFAQGSAVGPLAGDSGDWGSFLSTRPLPKPQSGSGGGSNSGGGGVTCISVYNPDGSLHCMTCYASGGGN
jgi:hypothetical protein